MTDTALNTTTATTTTIEGERVDLIGTLRKHRELFKQTTVGMSDEQAATRSTISSFTLGGLIKHVAQMEHEWAQFIVEGPAALGNWDDIDWTVGPPPEAYAEFEAGMTMLEGDTLAGLIERYDEVAAATDALLATVDLDAAHPLPSAPWFEQGASWSARRVALHLVAETAQHAGHADIIRETIDGAKTMG